MAVKQTPVAILADANILIKDVVSASFFDLNKSSLAATLKAAWSQTDTHIEPAGVQLET